MLQVADEETQRAMLAYYHKKQQEQEVIVQQTHNRCMQLLVASRALMGAGLCAAEDGTRRHPFLRCSVGRSQSTQNPLLRRQGSEAVLSVRMGLSHAWMLICIVRCQLSYQRVWLRLELWDILARYLQQGTSMFYILRNGNSLLISRICNVCCKQIQALTYRSLSANRP